MSKRNRKREEEKTLKERRADFRKHGRTYLVMSTFFILFNLFTVGSLGWAMWPILGWGIGVTLQALSLYGPLADPEETYPREPRRHREDPLPDLEDHMELRDLERQPTSTRPYRDEDLV